jgi:hypothetical protein
MLDKIFGFFGTLLAAVMIVGLLLYIGWSTLLEGLGFRHAPKGS